MSLAAQQGFAARTMSPTSGVVAKRLPCSVAIAVPTYLREDILVQTLENALSLNPPADEILVVDQTDEHGPATQQFLSAQAAAGRLRWIKHGPPNLPGARNRALRESTCEVVIFVDDDVVMPADFVERHAANYGDASVDGVAGRILQDEWGSLPSRRRWPAELDYRFMKLDGATRRVGVGNFMGANHSVRRTVMLGIGGYDENYIFNGFREDTDAALRLYRGKHTLVFDPAACLTHLQIPSGGCQTRAKGTGRPRWTSLFGEHYFFIRNFFPRPRFWSYLLIINVRKHVFRLDNLRRPWRLPSAGVAYVYAFVQAAKAARRRGALR